MELQPINALSPKQGSRYCPGRACTCQAVPFGMVNYRFWQE